MEVSVNHPFYFGILKYKPSSYWDSRSHMGFPRRQSTDLMAQMEQMRKQLDDAKKDRLGSPKN
jgi:hypothetical protein